MTTRLPDDQVSELRRAAAEHGLHIRFDNAARVNGLPFVLVRTGTSPQALTLAECAGYEDTMQWLGVKK